VNSDCRFSFFPDEPKVSCYALSGIREFMKKGTNILQQNIARINGASRYEK
jgi:hypothetical protein